MEAFCFYCQGSPDQLESKPEQLLELFQNLSYRGFHCQRQEHRASFHQLIPQIAIGWCCGVFAQADEIFQAPAQLELPVAVIEAQSEMLFDDHHLFGQANESTPIEVDDDEESKEE